MSMDTYEFSIDMDVFLKRGREASNKRLLTIATLSVAVCFTAFWLSLYGWLAILLIGTGSLFAVELFLFKKSVAFVKTLTLRLSPQALETTAKGMHFAISYDDLTLTNLKKINNRVQEICLKSKFGQKIRLKNFKDMDQLAAIILERVGSPRRAGQDPPQQA